MENWGKLPYTLPMSLLLSPAAATRLDTLRLKQDKAALFLRITVDGGGCQGFEYKFSFADAPSTDDVITQSGDIGLVTDPISMGFLENATIDFEDELIGSKFVVKNPNAASSCGCGTSFNVG